MSPPIVSHLVGDDHKFSVYAMLALRFCYWDTAIDAVLCIRPGLGKLRFQKRTIGSCMKCFLTWTFPKWREKILETNQIHHAPSLSKKFVTFPSISSIALPSPETTKAYRDLPSFHCPPAVETADQKAQEPWQPLGLQRMDWTYLDILLIPYTWIPKCLRHLLKFTSVFFMTKTI